MIKIGLSSCIMHPEPGRATFAPKYLYYMEGDMVRYIARDDALPVLIPNVERKKLERYIAQMDGIVFQGGVDVAPESYGEKGIENNRWPGDKMRDDYELQIMEIALKHRIPIFAICRGMQIANVFFGGTLYQDMVTQGVTARDHRSAEKYDTIHHGIELVEGGYLSKLYPEKKRIEVNTVHHQGIKQLGEKLALEARGLDDNVVEAFTYQDMQEQYLLAVQWHPEFSPTLEGVVESSIPLVEDFLEQARVFNRNKK